MYSSSNSLSSTASSSSSPTSSSATCPICHNPAEKQCQACHNVSYCSVKHQKEDWKQHRLDCSPYILKNNTELNRYVIASRKLKPGTIILEEHPCIYGPRVSPPILFGKDANDFPAALANAKTILCLSCCKQFSGKSICTKCKWPVCSSACAKVCKIIHLCFLYYSHCCKKLHTRKY